VLLNLLENGEPVRGFTGLRVKSVDDAIARAQKLPAVQGALVEEVLDRGPGAAARLKKGDVVLRIGNDVIDGASAFRIATAFAAPGAHLAVRYMRNGEAAEASLTIAQQAEEATAGTTMEIEALPGVRLREPVGATAGLLVEQVEADSPFVKQLKPGMLILEINDAKIATRAAATAALQPGPNKVRVQEDELTVTLSLRVK
jgi:S1-C subfamily serine protease